MRIAARLFLFSWLMVFGGCGEEEHDHDHDHDHGHEHHDHDGDHDHDHGGDGDAGAGGQDGGESGRSEPINSFCPLDPDEAVNAEATVVYEGQTVAFCCKKCAGKFEKLAPPEKAEAFAAIK